MQVKVSLDELRKKPPIPLTKNIMENVNGIIKLCDERYSAKKWHGADALNRMIHP